jgi:mannose/fructose/N-acetylgalactosamine-specific phosphotransferase system component IIB
MRDMGKGEEIKIYVLPIVQFLQKVNEPQYKSSLVMVLFNF